MPTPVGIYFILITSSITQRGRHTNADIAIENCIRSCVLQIPIEHFHLD